MCLRTVTLVPARPSDRHGDVVNAGELLEYGIVHQNHRIHAAVELHRLYGQLSDDLMHLQVTVQTASMGANRTTYRQGYDANPKCRGSLTPLLEDAMEIVAAAGFSFTDIDAVALVDPWDEGAWAAPNAHPVSRPHVNGNLLWTLNYEGIATDYDPLWPARTLPSTIPDRSRP